MMHILLFRLVRGLAVIVLGLHAAAAAAAPSEAEALAVGTWYGEYSAGEGQPMQRFLTTRFADGTYILVAKMYDKGNSSPPLHNKGLWSISNGLYFTITTEVDGKRTESKTADTSNPYLVRNLTKNTFEYQHIPTGRTFHVKRVDPASTRLPD